MDIVVIYKGDAGFLLDSEKTALEALRQARWRPGHDSLCGPDPDYVATLLGGAKKHGEVATNRIPAKARARRRPDWCVADTAEHIRFNPRQSRRSQDAKTCGATRKRG